ncbi:GTSF1 [Branchiostoma lanceolatum]|uniref:GTSF1 protein n=1 Tax=Branchiostoma lanceolatum TaxID=7740 RepID=A0A8K0ABQ0_BRALA|nr:GTSF1 [Branchiostoma lanceolatum]
MARVWGKYNTMDVVDPNEEFVCPYDPVHVIRASRMPYHLMKCRRNYAHNDMRTCPFNARHVVPIGEHRHHIANCPDRKVLDVHTSFETEEQEGGYFKGCTAVPAYNSWEAPPAEENWEQEAEHHNAAAAAAQAPQEQGGDQELTAKDLALMTPAQKKNYKRKLRKEQERKAAESAAQANGSAASNSTKLRIPQNFSAAACFAPQQPAVQHGIQPAQPNNLTYSLNMGGVGRGLLMSQRSAGPPPIKRPGPRIAANIFGNSAAATAPQHQAMSNGHAIPTAQNQSLTNGHGAPTVQAAAHTQVVTNGHSIPTAQMPQYQATNGHGIPSSMGQMPPNQALANSHGSTPAQMPQYPAVANGHSNGVSAAAMAPLSSQPLSDAELLMCLGRGRGLSGYRQMLQPPTVGQAVARSSSNGSIPELEGLANRHSSPDVAGGPAMIGAASALPPPRFDSPSSSASDSQTEVSDEKVGDSKKKRLYKLQKKLAQISALEANAGQGRQLSEKEKAKVQTKPALQAELMELEWQLQDLGLGEN